MVANWNKTGSVPAPPPRELHVERFAVSRAPELQSLHSIVAQRLGNNYQSQRNKRRRTTGHDDRNARKRFRKGRAGVEGNNKNDSGKKDEGKLPRRIRRKIEFTKTTSSGFFTSGDGTKRLTTHRWHAKRFTMTKFWGFHLPLGLHGRGRGSRALLKMLTHGVLMHDASYYGCIQLKGSEEALMSVLTSLLVPSPLVYSKELWNSILDGTSFGTAMIHHDGKSCYDQPIAPVTYMWQPRFWIYASKDKISIDGEQKVGDGCMFRQLWIWIHAAAFREAYDALCSACGRLEGTSSIQCWSREGQLAKLELFGSKVFDLLKNILLPSTSFENSWHMMKCLADKHDCAGELEKTSIFETGDKISVSNVVSMVVKDPRTLNEKVRVSVSDSKPLVYEEPRTKSQTFSSSPNNKAERIFENGDLWSVAEEVCPPVEESVLCMEKHHRKMEFVRIGHKSSGYQKASSDGKYSRVCPILLLKDENPEASFTRCSIVLPVSWVRAFWNTFISNGAHAIGLREKHWVSCATGLPYFPLDFPDCRAYSSFLAVESDASSDKAKLLPPSKRLLKNPLPAPWDCVHLTLEKTSSKSENSLTQVAEVDGQNGTSVSEKRSGDGIPETRPYSQDVSFQGVIARTSHMMTDLLNNTIGHKYLLFPKLDGLKSCLSKVMKDSEFFEHNTTIRGRYHGSMLCYFRVLICAYKEGVFEQGAVVCAPHVADIMISKSGGQNLQIPQSSLQLPSSTQLQIHENLALCESYRWPIGFITTGFVRGSKKQMAGAVCEASLLSRLREEQWKAFPVRQRKKEIYVLVRNMKSTAYRLGLATIVLEQQEDVKFM